MVDTPQPALNEDKAGQESRIERVSLLFRLTAFERYAYLALSVVSAAGLLVLAGLILSHEQSWKTAVTMMGPAGIIAYSQGRVLSVWTKTAKMLGLGE